MSYQTRHFALEELVDPTTLQELGPKAWILFDDRALITLDALRDEFGPITVNNWHKGGPRRWSGFRPQDCPVGAEYSQHRYGRAFDCIFAQASADDVRKDLLEDPDGYPYITAIEVPKRGEEMGWLHFDCRNVAAIKTFTP